MIRSGPWRAGRRGSEPAEVEAPVGGDVARDVGGDASGDEGLLSGEHEGWGGAEGQYIATEAPCKALCIWSVSVAVAWKMVMRGLAVMEVGRLGGVAAETIDMHVGGFQEVFGDQQG